MPNNEVSTEDKILQSANKIFVLYGYHGTRLQQIANEAGVHKSAIHYYFRSKEKLYTKVIKHVLEHILKKEIYLITDQEIIEKQKWFLITELYNNQNLFERTVKELYQNDWDKKLIDIKELLKFGETLFNNFTNGKANTAHTPIR